MSTRSDVDASVSYYGVGLDELMGEVHDIRMPLILHIAALDKFMQGTAREKVLKGAAKNPAITAYVYEGVDHAFARPNGQNYNDAAAKLAQERTDKFFEEYLKDKR
jgi:carboxymethylenebutenolidase